MYLRQFHNFWHIINKLQSSVEKVSFHALLMIERFSQRYYTIIEKGKQHLYSYFSLWKKKGDDINASPAQYMDCTQNYVFFNHWHSRTATSDFGNTSSAIFSLSQHE